MSSLVLGVVVIVTFVVGYAFGFGAGTSRGKVEAYEAELGVNDD